MPRLLSPLPPQAAIALRQARIPLDSVGIWIAPLGKNRATLALNAQRPMNPASTIKLVTTWVALQTLGPDYRWTTFLYSDGTIERGVLHGDLYVRGSGDPKLTPEELEKALVQLRAAGIARIDGDLVLDTSLFSPTVGSEPTIDGDKQRAYNVAPHALLYAFKTVSFRFLPETNGVKIDATPPLDDLLIDNRLQAGTGACGDWRAGLDTLVSETSGGRVIARFAGRYPSSCGERQWNVAVLDHEPFFRNGFVALWQTLGGSFSRTPVIRRGTVPAQARLLVSHRGLPLADAVRDINKFSNNVMARQLFLTIGRERTGQPADTAQAAQVVRDWLTDHRLAMPELVLENGSGLSRIERISAQSLGILLDQAAHSPLAQTFAASLPQAGVDGTMQRRLSDRSAGNEAWLKTGSLNEVRAIAGYVQNAQGENYVLISFINHANAAQAQPFHDALIQWLFEGGLKVQR